MANPDADVGVTEENFGELLIESLTEAPAAARGTADRARRVNREGRAAPPSDPPPGSTGARVSRG